jgi:N-acyl-D-aspartate/D-glutamate deacylase
MPEFVNDFPGGHGRFIQRADGYRATICNGEVILENDEHTGARGGRVLRNQR